MAIDAGIVLAYFAIIFIFALRGRVSESASSEEYFLSSRNLKWPSIAISTIATNIQGYQFLGMMGSAYLYGLAQANLEINAVQGLLLAAIVFVPMYLKDRVITITQFIQNRLGKNIGLLYTCANMLLFSTIGLGAALFWGAYTADFVFSEYLSLIHEDKLVRMTMMIMVLGVFSAIYTYLGGLNAVVKTDIIQFAILVIGALVVLFVITRLNGGWGALYEKTPELMHLHLPANHEKLPWTLMIGLFFLNINYWCANQTVMQRSLAAKNLQEAQVGLMVGGVLKYGMAILIVIPGIALAGYLGSNGLADPDEAFPYIVSNYIPVGFRGLILCALFASIMSTVDSTFNSLATLFSIDIYQGYINPKASDSQLIRAGRRTILFTLLTGVIVGTIILYLKYNNPESAFTHTLNELRYFINCGIVVVIITAAFLFLKKYPQFVIVTVLLTVPLNFALKIGLPEMNYFLRAGLVIISSLSIMTCMAIFTNNVRPPGQWFQSAGNGVTRAGIALAISLIIIHLIFS